MQNEKFKRPIFQNRKPAPVRFRATHEDLAGPSKANGLSLVVGVEKLNSKNLESQINSLDMLFHWGDSNYGLASAYDKLQRFRLILSTLLFHNFEITLEVKDTIGTCMPKYYLEGREVRMTISEEEMAEILSSADDFIELIQARKALGALPIVEDASQDPSCSPIAEFNTIKQLQRVRTFLEFRVSFQERNRRLDEELALALETMRGSEVSPEELHFKELSAKFKLSQQEKVELPKAKNSSEGKAQP